MDDLGYRPQLGTSPGHDAGGRRHRGARVGDVLEFDLDDSTVAVAHVLAQHELLDLYLGVFAGAFAHGARPNISAFADVPYVLLGHTVDNYVRDGRWRIVGRLSPDRDRFPLPRFKRWNGGPNSQPVVVSWDDADIRDAEPDELPVLLAMRNHDPGKLQAAARAINGLEPWREAFDELRSERVVASHGRAPGPAGPEPSPAREVPPDTPTTFIALFLFEGASERGRAASDKLHADGWETRFSEEQELLQAQRRVRWGDVLRLRDEVNRLEHDLGATESGYEYSVRRT
jgi:hypothetical protein